VVEVETAGFRLGKPRSTILGFGTFGGRRIPACSPMLANQFFYKLLVRSH
jgi:hypothetical protein